MGGCGSKDLSQKDIEAVQRIVGDGQSHVEQSLNRSIETLLAEHRKELKALEGFQKAVDSQKEQIDSQKRQIEQLKHQNDEQSSIFDERSNATELELENANVEVDTLRRNLEKSDKDASRKLDKIGKESKEKIGELEREISEVRNQKEELEVKLDQIVLEAERKLQDVKDENRRDHQELDEKYDEARKGMEIAIQEKEEHEKKTKELTDLLDMFRKMHAPGTSASLVQTAEVIDTNLALVALAPDPAKEDSFGGIQKQNFNVERKSPSRVPNPATMASNHGPHARQLIAIKDKTARRLNWVLDDEMPLNRWDGIRANSEDKVTHITLSDANLKIDLVELGHVFGPQMESIKLDKNPDLGGNLAHLLGNNLDASNTWLQEQKLATVDLHYTQVAGSIVVFQNCPYLRTIALGYTKVHGDIEVFRNCPLLKELRLYMCRGISGNISVCANNPELQWLDLTGTAVNGDISVFTKTPKLQWLWLDDTKVEGDISVFVTTQNLVEVWLGGTKVSGDKQQFERVLPRCSIVM